MDPVIAIALIIATPLIALNVYYLWRGPDEDDPSHMTIFARKKSAKKS